MSAQLVIALVFIVILIVGGVVVMMLINARQRREMHERLRMDRSTPARDASAAAPPASPRNATPRSFPPSPTAAGSFGEPPPFSRRPATSARDTQSADPFNAWSPDRSSANAAWRGAAPDPYGSFGAGIVPPSSQSFPGYPANPAPSPYPGQPPASPPSPPVYGAGSSVPAWTSPPGAPLPWSPPVPRTPLSALARQYQEHISVQYDPSIDALQVQFESCRMQSAEEVSAAFQSLEAQVAAALARLGRSRAALLVDLAGLEIGDAATQDWGRALRQFLEACCVQTSPGHFLIARYNSRSAADRPSLSDIQAAVTGIQVMTEAAIQGFRSNIVRSREEAVALLLRLRQLAGVQGY